MYASSKSNKTSAKKIIKAPEWQDSNQFANPIVPKRNGTIRSKEYDIQIIGPLTVEQKQCLYEILFTDTHECPICFETKPKEEFHAIKGCTHLPHCAICVGLSVTEDINGKGITRFRCKETNCSRILTVEDIQRVLSRANFNRFNHLMTMRYLDSLQEFIYCSRVGCGAGMLHVGGDDMNIVTCYVCKWKTCFIHRTQMHIGLSCKDYDAWRDTASQTGNPDDQETLTNTVIQQTTRPCPGCGIRVEKNRDHIGDCDKLTCRRVLPETGEECGVEFCWHCQGQYFGGDPKNDERVRVYQCDVKGHKKKYRNPRVSGGVGLHCHHKKGCYKLDPQIDSSDGYSRIYK